MWKQILLNPKIQLENSRAILTHLNLEHLEPLSKVGLDPRLWIHNPAYNCDTKEKLKEYIDDAIKCRQEFSRVSFAIFDKKFNKYAGSSSFYAISEVNRKLAIGYTWYGVDFQRTGLNASAKSIMYDLAFNTLGCVRVEFHTDSENLVSRAQIQHYGCQFEGIMRKDKLKVNGKFRDTAQYSILDNEYVQQKSKLYIQ